MNRINTIDLYTKYAEQFDSRIGSLTQYHQSYTDFVKMAENTETLLDLACGPGNVSAFLQKLIPAVSITCVDFSGKMLELAEAKIANGTFYKSDILDIRIPPKKYGMIVCAFGLPYIAGLQVGTFVSELNRFAGTGTTVYISCMQGDRSQYETMSFAKDEQVLVHYHSKESILDNFEKQGFVLLDYREQDYIEMDGAVTVDMIFILRKQ